jgi:hypothetical protein
MIFLLQNLGVCFGTWRWRPAGPGSAKCLFREEFCFFTRNRNLGRKSEIPIDSSCTDRIIQWPGGSKSKHVWVFRKLVLPKVRWRYDARQSEVIRKTLNGWDDRLKRPVVANSSWIALQKRLTSAEPDDTDEDMSAE